MKIRDAYDNISEAKNRVESQLKYGERYWDPDGFFPPQFAPLDSVTTTYDNPITKPIKLKDDIAAEFGSRGASIKLSDYRGITPDIPDAGTIKISDFDGVSGTATIEGYFFLDRWDDFFGAGLFPNADRTWNKADQYLGIPEFAHNNEWVNGWGNSYKLVYMLQSNRAKVIEVIDYEIDCGVYKFNYNMRPVFWLSGVDLDGNFGDLSLSFKYEEDRTLIEKKWVFVKNKSKGTHFYWVPGATDAEVFEKIKSNISSGGMIRWNCGMPVSGNVGIFTYFRPYVKARISMLRD